MTPNYISLFHTTKYALFIVVPLTRLVFFLVRSRVFHFHAIKQMKCEFRSQLGWLTRIFIKFEFQFSLTPIHIRRYCTRVFVFRANVSHGIIKCCMMNRHLLLPYQYSGVRTISQMTVNVSFSLRSKKIWKNPWLTCKLPQFKKRNFPEMFCAHTRDTTTTTTKNGWSWSGCSTIFKRNYWDCFTACVMEMKVFYIVKLSFTMRRTIIRRVYWLDSKLND